MQITVVQFSIEGLVDDDYPPIVIEGHLTLEQATDRARAYGWGYPYCCCVACDGHPHAAFYANYSNEENPPTNDDGTVEAPSQGHLEVWFFHTEVQSA